MALLDLQTGRIARTIEGAVAVDVTSLESADRSPWHDTAAISIDFPKFTDGRGFTAGRRVRDEHGFNGAIIATGNVIPDQADYLRRCGFSHVVIAAETQSQWQFALSAIASRFQHMPGTPRSRPG